MFLNCRCKFCRSLSFLIMTQNISFLCSFVLLVSSFPFDSLKHTETSFLSHVFQWRKTHFCNLLSFIWHVQVCVYIVKWSMSCLYASKLKFPVAFQKINWNFIFAFVTLQLDLELMNLVFLLQLHPQGSQQFLKWKFKNNSRTFEEYINTFQKHKRW